MNERNRSRLLEVLFALGFSLMILAVPVGMVLDSVIFAFAGLVGGGTFVYIVLTLDDEAGNERR